MIYAYKCERCGESFTVEATLAEKARGLKVVCPRCESRDVAQDFSGVGLMRGPGADGPSGCCGPGSGAGCC